MNWQHCSRTLFLGLGDSYEQYYQAIRRVWSFGQQRPVDVRIVISDVEGAIAENVKAQGSKRRNHMAESIVAAVKDNQSSVRRARRRLRDAMSRGREVERDARRLRRARERDR
jgi:hypothetical protein